VVERIMKIKLLYIIAFIMIGIGILSFYDIGNTPKNTALQELSVGAMKRFVLHDKPLAAPIDSFIDQNGNEATFSDFKGKVILVNLWATWCAPCRKEMPDLNELQKSMDNEKFEVVLISENQDGIESSVAYLDEYNITHLDTYLDTKRKIARAFKTNAMPTSVLINADGYEVGRLLGPAEWNSGDAKALINYFIVDKSLN
jgi:thiol-disulfide isomerase/thioredoxin